MVIPSSQKQYFQELKPWALEQIRAGQISIALMAEVREAFPGDWQVEELVRAIIFDETQLIEYFRTEAEREESAHKEP